MPYEKISELITKCTQEELLQIKGKISLLINEDKQTLTPLEQSMERLWISLTLKLKEKYGTPNFTNFYLLKKNKTSSYKKLKETVVFLENFFLIYTKYKNSISDIQINTLFSNLMVDSLQNKGPQYILNCYAEFPNLLNRAFPGYYESGLLHMLFSNNK